MSWGVDDFGEGGLSDWLGGENGWGSDSRVRDWSSDNVGVGQSWSMDSGVGQSWSVDS
jgi:hypothetical protein